MPPPAYKQEIVVFKKTTDDWCENYKVVNGASVSDLVELSLSGMFEVGTTTIDKWRICAWGNDELGMWKDFKLSQKDEALSAFMEIISLEDVTQEFLYEKGFVRFS